MADVAQHYDADYFAWQQTDGGAEMDAAATLWMFKPHLPVWPGVILDFGCAGGHFLDVLPGGFKLGVEINPASRKYAQSKGYRVETDLAVFDDESIDAIVSKHALEHTTDPFDKVRLMLAKLRAGGTLVMTVPCERYDTTWVPDNQDRHLYTWSPMNLGNLVRAAGFEVLSCERVAYRFPPRPQKIYRIVGPCGFYLLARAWGWLFPKLTQVRVVARKPA